jgi:hypothetical protein
MANEEHLKILMEGDLSWFWWRYSNPNVIPNLSEANLYRAELEGLDLGGLIEFKGKNGFGIPKYTAHYSHLSFANLSEANLVDANLKLANLYFANLRGADLSGANLEGASLRGANLYGAKLDGAKFSRCKLDGTLFGNNDLSRVVGLDTVIHRGPSTVGVDTIYVSKGKIPKKFLRGCGIPETFITYMHLLSEQPIQFYSCFISYSHADKSFARRLHDALQGKGIRCWLDEHQLLPGDRIYTEVDRGIRLWDKVLLCCSKESLASWWVENEIQIAFEKEQQLRKQRGQDVLALIPLNLDGYLFGDECKHGLAAQIRARLAADFTGWETDNSKFETEFEKLVRALRADAGGREQPPQAKL